MLHVLLGSCSLNLTQPSVADGAGVAPGLVGLANVMRALAVSTSVPVEPVQARKHNERPLIGLFWFTTFVHEVGEFIYGFGNLWSLSDRAAEEAVHNAVWMVQKLAPFSDVDQSYLRLALARTEHKELYEFQQEIQQDQRLSDLLQDWTVWLDTCTMPVEEHDIARCQLHAAVHYAMIYVNAIEEEWEALAGVYGREFLVQNFQRVEELAAFIRQTSPG